MINENYHCASLKTDAIIFSADSIDSIPLKEVIRFSIQSFYAILLIKLWI